MFHLDVASVSCGCCKSRSRCYICCNGCTRMLQASVSNVSSIFLHVCCKYGYVDVAYVFTHMLRVFYLMLRMFAMVFKCFSYVFASVSSAFRRMFEPLHLDVSKVDQLLHMLQRDPSSAATSFSCWAKRAQTTEGA